MWSAVSGAAVAFGPVTGGFLLEHFWWGSVFYVNVPVTALAAVALARLRWGTGMAATQVRGVVIGLTAAEAGLLLLIAAIYYWRL